MGKDKLSIKERREALVKKQGLDRVPVNPSVSIFAAKLCNMSARDYFLFPQKAFRAQMWAIDMFEYDAGPSYHIPEWVNWDFGGEVEFPLNPKTSLPKATKRIIKGEEDILNIQLPNPKTAPASSRILEFYRICAENGFGVSIYGGSPLNLVQQLIGTEKLLRWMGKKPKLIHDLLRLSTDYLLKIAKLYSKEFGAEKISVFTAYPMDSHGLISPKQFEKFSLVYVKEIHEKFNAMGINKWTVHLCGDHRKNLDYWKNEIVLGDRTIFTLGNEMDMKETSKRLGDKYIIGGNIRNTLLELCNPDEIYEEAKKIVLEMKDIPGGFILMPDCVLSPNTPPANLYAMIKAAKDFGRYD